MQQNETQQSVLSTVQQEMASRRSKIGSGLNRQDSRLSVKTLIESIENNKVSNEKSFAVDNGTDYNSFDTIIFIYYSYLNIASTIFQFSALQPKVEETESHYSSTSSLNSATPEISSNNMLPPLGNAVAAGAEWSENVSTSKYLCMYAYILN